MSDDKELNELLRLIEKEAQEQTKTPVQKSRKFKENPSVKRFIRLHNVEKGDLRIPTYLIYYFYGQWCLEQRIKKLGKEGFFRTFAKYFEAGRTGHRRFYYLNDCFKYNEEILEHAKSYNRKKNNARGRKKGE